MLARCTDPARINAVVNHPAVRPGVGLVDMGDLDMSPVIGEPHWWLMGEHGGFALMWSAPGVREVHTFILPEGRGRWAAKARSEGIAYAREHGTRMLWTKVPDGARHVEAFARAGGMKDCGETQTMFGKPYRIFAMELDQCR